MDFDQETKIIKDNIEIGKIFVIIRDGRACFECIKKGTNKILVEDFYYNIAFDIVSYSIIIEEGKQC